MKFDNPTSLKIGMSGTIAGIRYRVVGRVVMGMEEAGRTYYWNEFNLVNDQGKFATLVFEETEYGAEWKMFTLFEPQNSLTANEAATKRVGDTVSFNQGAPLRVTLVDESRVYFIEGQPPEDVEVDDIAHYFNAESKNKMQVASWTGDEIEFYNGMNLPRNAVRNAFGLAADPSLNFHIGQNDKSVAFQWVPKLIGAAAICIIVFTLYSIWTSGSSAKGPVKSKLAPSKLEVGKSGKLLGTVYRIEGHSVVDVAKMNHLYDRHEYHLATEDAKALLVNGLKAGAKDWFLFTPFQPENAMKPERAAAIRAGDSLDIGDRAVKVTDLFQMKITKTEGVGATNGAVFYGFNAEAPDFILLARWNQENITFYRGQNCTEKSVTSTFK